VVAETQHLTEAAAQLDITPAALSRTISKLEEEIGTRLFDRVHRGMVLTGDGARLAHQVRDAMRMMDDAIAAMSPTRAEAKWVHIAFEGHAIGSLLHHSLEGLIRPGTRLGFESMQVSKMATALLAGDIDLAFAPVPTSDDRIVCKPIGEVACRWVTLLRTIPLPPEGPVADISTQPAVAPVSPVVLQHAALLLPSVIALPRGTRTSKEQRVSLWRITRTRPARALLSIANDLMAVTRRGE